MVIHELTTAAGSEHASYGSSYSCSQELLDTLSDFRAAIVVCHDYPDPDAIAAGWAIQRLIEKKLRIPVRLLARGQVLRPENRTLLELLGPPLELVSRAREIDRDAAAILVDCEPGATNHLLTDLPMMPLAVVDHHNAQALPFDVAFADIRPDVAATTSIAASYLREQFLVPDERLATAMLYALHTETRGGETTFTSLDRAILTWLTGLANPTWLAQIETAPFHCSYVGHLTQALQATLVYGDTAFCYFPAECEAGLVAEIADLLIRCEELRYVFCAAAFGRDVLISVRADRTDQHAGDLVQRLVEGLGRGGGHRHRAGAKIPEATELELNSEELCCELRRRWLRLCGATGRRAKLLARPKDSPRTSSTAELPCQTGPSK